MAKFSGHESTWAWIVASVVASVASKASRAAAKRANAAGSPASWALAASVSAPSNRSGAPAICS